MKLAFYLKFKKPKSINTKVLCFRINFKVLSLNKTKTKKNKKKLFTYKLNIDSGTFNKHITVYY